MHEIIEGRIKEGEEEFKCYTIWQMMVALLRSNGQLRTERYMETEKGCQKPTVQQKTTDDDGCYEGDRGWLSHKLVVTTHKCYYCAVVSDLIPGIALYAYSSDNYLR